MGPEILQSIKDSKIITKEMRVNHNNGNLAKPYSLIISHLCNIVQVTAVKMIIF